MTATVPPIVRVVVQHRQRLLRDSLAAILEAAGAVVLATTASGDELEVALGRHRPDVVVLEGARTPWDLASIALAAGPAMRLVGLCALPDDLDRRRAVAAGISDVVDHATGLDALVEAVLAGTAPPVPSAASPPSPARPADTLTRRGVEILELVGRGRTTGEIAADLGISPKTVENHKQRIYARLGVQNQAHAVAVAIAAGALPGPAPRGCSRWAATASQG